MSLNAATGKMARSLVAQGFTVGLGHYLWNPSAQSWRASAAEVEVDMLTGQVNVLKLAAAHDCGRVIYRRGADAQVLGGTIMGIGFRARASRHRLAGSPADASDNLPEARLCAQLQCHAVAADSRAPPAQLSRKRSEHG